MRLSTLYEAAVICGLAMPVLASNSSPVASREPVHSSKAEVAQLRKNAHTPDQYHALAVYYGDRKTSFQDQATQMKNELERRSQSVVGPAAKYPRPVDSARNLYEYYAYEASQAGVLQAQYQHLAESGSEAARAGNPTR